MADGPPGDGKAWWCTHDDPSRRPPDLPGPIDRSADAVRPYTVAFVFARGGSKGLVDKNLRLIGGKPLVGHAVATARSSTRIDRVVVSTDDPRIAAVATGHGAEVPWLRPAELATDDAPEWLCWQHALSAVNAEPGSRPIEVFVSLPPTAPLRSTDDVDGCIDLFQAADADIVMTVSPAAGNPYFNMVTMDEAGYARLVGDLPAPVARRQDAPRVFDITTVAYVARPEFVLTAGGMFEGSVRAFVVPPERAVDIDDELDLEFARFLFDRLGQTDSGPTGRR